jgi:hypothetical protein
MTEKPLSAKNAKKPKKPRCTNCGDETAFPENTDPRREAHGWCSTCWRQAGRGLFTSVAPNGGRDA